ncbi:hypothetical protein FQN52_004896 [Onygenales sp. PD_12]|nr:hypothetical protein FQN52_004896 [Onygenales sp. PD_12]KAK2786253.1 hypothetical protein FQN53_006807 [Emmonsiellopsis sp. PD_33]KAK2797531.1 hypothetical protein FQN51_008430 [Onygenales sp. PD_10]
MATSFSSLPIVDLTLLSSPQGMSKEEQAGLASQLYDVFATTGFAYLVNHPLSFDHEAIFRLAREFFAIPDEEKMKLAKKSFQKNNQNTYRGYFPTQPDLATDNLKEGFEIGTPNRVATPQSSTSVNPKPNATSKLILSEPNVWPAPNIFRHRSSLEQLHNELQSLSATILSLLAISLGKESNFFSPYLADSLSTLRLLHYPPTNPSSSPSSNPTTPQDSVKLSCTPHTDSGILTLLHQDATGGLEVRDSAGSWVAAPYVPGSIVVNIGDLMAKVSGRRFVATMHRVRAPAKEEGEVFGRFSVPFFFEPGEKCVVRSVDGEADGAEGEVVYGDHVRAKMKTWVEFRDL